MTTRSHNGNAAAYFVDRHAGEGRADKTAFQETGAGGRALSYGALAQAAARFGGALLRSGMRPEERMAMVVLDQIEFPVAFWGALKAGIVPIPINTLLGAPLYASILDDSRATTLLVSAEMWDTVRPAALAAPHVTQIIVIGDAPDGTTGFDAFVDGAPPAETVARTPDDLAFWLYSSGSTGVPKGVRHVHGALQATYDTYGRKVLGIAEDDRVYSAAKFFFAYGLGNALTFPMAVGATTVIHAGRPAPEGVFDILATHRPTLFFGVPTLFAAMVSAQEASGQPPDHSLRLCASAGEALPRDVGERWERLWQTRIIDGVGSTEMLHIFLSNRPEDRVYGTSGRPVPGYDVRLVDEADAEVATGDIGELLVRGESSADGYWNRRTKSRATFQGDWTRTGDKYERREDGRFVYCGRTDDMFKTSGIWVSPFEVESALVDHPAVLEAAVVARRDDEGLEKPAAYIVLNGAAPPDLTAQLQAFVKERVGLWKYPRWIEIVDDLPKTATGKIQRFKLRDTDHIGDRQ